MFSGSLGACPGVGGVFHSLWRWRRGEAGCDVLALLYFGCLHTNVIDVYV